jgi:hypothetical protein
MFVHNPSDISSIEFSESHMMFYLSDGASIVFRGITASSAEAILDTSHGTFEVRLNLRSMDNNWALYVVKDKTTSVWLIPKAMTQVLPTRYLSLLTSIPKVSLEERHE